MFALLATTIITCSQAYELLNRIQSNTSVPKYIRDELVETIRETIPTCPVKVKEDERRKSN